MNFLVLRNFQTLNGQDLNGRFYDILGISVNQAVTFGKAKFQRWFEC